MRSGTALPLRPLRYDLNSAPTFRTSPGGIDNLKFIRYILAFRTNKKREKNKIKNGHRIAKIK
jgi:hypothetical protein